jgi:hypothetical protein
MAGLGAASVVTGGFRSLDCRLGVAAVSRAPKPATPGSAKKAHVRGKSVIDRVTRNIHHLEE